MSDDLYFSGGPRPTGEAPQFDTEAFRKRFNEILHENTCRQSPAAQNAAVPPQPAQERFLQPEFPQERPAPQPAQERFLQPEFPQERPAPQQAAVYAPAAQKPPVRRQLAYEERLAPADEPAPEAKAEKKKRKKKKSKFRRAVRGFICILLVLILLAAGGAVGTVFYVTKDYKASPYVENAYIDESTLMRSPGVTNILLMGIDTQHVSDQPRSDTMILLSIDTIHATLKLTSFMRDMYVEVPGYGSTNLTHACAYEGPQLTVDAIELNFGVRIDGYAKIGYEIFIELVDGIGGITVPEIDETEARALAQEGVDVGPGQNVHLNGRQALNYCRIRKGQSDFQRTERQREAVSLILQQAKKTNPFTLLKLASSIAAQVECSLDRREMISLAVKTVPCLAGTTEQQQIPADGTWSNGTRDGMSVLLVDTEANKKVLKEFIY